MKIVVIRCRENQLHPRNVCLKSVTTFWQSTAECWFSCFVDIEQVLAALTESVIYTWYSFVKPMGSSTFPKFLFNPNIWILPLQVLQCSAMIMCFFSSLSFQRQAVIFSTSQAGYFHDDSNFASDIRTSSRQQNYFVLKRECRTVFFHVIEQWPSG